MFLLFLIIIVTCTPHLLKPWHDYHSVLEVRHPLLSVFWGLLLLHMLARIPTLLFWLLSYTEKHSSDFPFLLPTCLLPVGSSLSLILQLILAKFLPLLSASSLLAAPC